MAPRTWVLLLLFFDQLQLQVSIQLGTCHGSMPSWHRPAAAAALLLLASCRCRCCVVIKMHVWWVYNVLHLLQQQ